jgi:D-3-phosphoglycerate dehydrogenase
MRPDPDILELRVSLSFGYLKPERRHEAMADQPLVLSLGRIHPVAKSILGGRCALREIPPISPDDSPPLLREAEGIIVRGDSRIAAAHIAAAPRLRVIGRTGAGVDNVDTVAASAAGIPVVFAPGMNVNAVAELTIGMFIILARLAPALSRGLLEGDWGIRDRRYGRELAGSTVGVIGLGKIGLRVADLCTGFGCKIQAYDPYVWDRTFDGRGISMVSLERLIQTSDFLSIHAPLTEDTRGLIDRRRIESMKHGAILVNVGRGGIVEDLDAVLSGLESGILAGVGLDVFPVEPPDVGHAVFRHPRCLATPHVAGMSEESMEAVFRSVASDVVAVLDGRRPRFAVERVNKS